MSSGFLTNTIIKYLNDSTAHNESATNGTSVDRFDYNSHHANFVWPEDDDIPVR